jgi:hypothetical protein
MEGKAMNLLFDPKIFNYVIMTLYGLNIGRWAWEMKWWDAAYWSFAFGITFVYTFGHDR